MRQSFNINGEYFRTKTDLQTRIRGILWGAKLGYYLPADDFAFMLDVLGHHPDYLQKIGMGVKGIYVKQNPVYTHTRTFYIVRLDGSETDFSYLECLHETTHYHRFENACRVAIEPAMIEYKQKFFDGVGGSYTCPYTGEPLNFRGAHVDHKAPLTFQRLLMDFIQETGLNVDAVKVNGKGDDLAVQDTLDDKTLEAQWIAYHNSRAHLQVVSRTANLSILKKQVYA